MVGKQQDLTDFTRRSVDVQTSEAVNKMPAVMAKVHSKMAKLVGTLCDDRAMVWVWLVLWRIVLSHSDNQRAQTISATFFFFDEHPLRPHGDLLQIWAAQVMGAGGARCRPAAEGQRGHGGVLSASSVPHVCAQLP